MSDELLTQKIRQIVQSWMNKTKIPNFGICSLDGLTRVPSHKEKLLPPSGSVLVFILPYYSDAFPDRNVSLYAIGDDYHEIAYRLLGSLSDSLKKQYPEHLFIPFADNGPVAEAEAAIKAGLGFWGLNHQFLTEEWGSFCFLGIIVTDLLLVSDQQRESITCKECKACIRACPTKALDEDHFQIERCRSYITQKKGILTAEEEEEIRDGKMVWGCDICTLACPYNRDPKKSPIADFHQNMDPIIHDGNYSDLIGRKGYGWRGEEVIRRNMRILQKKKE